MMRRAPNGVNDIWTQNSQSELWMSPTDGVEEVSRARESASAHAREMHCNAEVHSNQEVSRLLESGMALVC